MNDIIQELETLLIEWEAGNLEDREVERIREILRTSEPARSRYVQLRMIETALRLDSSVALSGLLPDASVEPPSTVDHPSEIVRLDSTPQKSRRSKWLLSGLSLAICLLTGWILYSELSGDSQNGDSTSEHQIADGPSPVIRKASDEATSEGIALITRLVEINWGENQQPLEVGSALTPGSLVIQSGYAQIEFFCGATVILEGPAELELQSAMFARVIRGRLRAQVPPAARGFALEVNGMKVVDLGTEFALAVSPEEASVQVFEGEVELHQPEAGKQTLTTSLTTGQAMTRTASGEYEKAELTPDRFIDIAGLESRARGQQTIHYQRWKDWSEKLRRDPRLIAYYTFENNAGGDRRLKCDMEPTDSELDGAIVGARPVIGRWEAKGALEFKQPADRVRVQVPGEFSSLTFACWVKIDSLDRWYNSLFLTDHYNQGEPHWQILDTGQLFFSVRSKPDPSPGESPLTGPTHQVVLSPPFWKPTFSGRWLHLVTTYDVDQKQVAHYLNGNILHQEMIADVRLMKTTRIGTASIGNWSLPTKPDAEFAIRNLNGSLDEFAIFAAALTAEEIKEMYKHGKP